MSTTQSLAEEFITTFHNANAGITAAAFATLPVQKSGRRYKCSYDCLAELIPDFKRQCSVLDLACGDGFLLSMLATRKQSGLSLAGIDMSAGEIDAARTRLGNAASLCLARAQSLPLQSKSVDYVLCHLAIMLMDNVESVVTEVQRVLRVGGTFSAVVGTRPLSSRAFDTYIELLAQYPKRKGMDFNRLGDSRFTTVTGIEEMFSKLFTKLTAAGINRRMSGFIDPPGR